MIYYFTKATFLFKMKVAFLFTLRLLHDLSVEYLYPKIIFNCLLSINTFFVP
jgi:hypothetical protein